MSVMTRVVAATAVLLGAAIPVGALTVKNTSDKDFTIGVSTGTEQKVHTVPAGGSLEVKQDCSSDCAVTGPWGFSHFVPQNAVIESDGAAIVSTRVATADTAPKPSSGLVPQDPSTAAIETPDEPAVTAAPAAKPAPAAQPPKRAAKSKARRQAKKAKKGPSPGSFGALMQGNQ
ncbi:MAG TPA: hypothetical protein PK857_08345 [Hyphomicrobium sp.]|nr:hypothetical protein [Hyphomicrobium sp.]HRO51056.1 hypothetical protein [Hyphomicrobium sp.]